MKIEKGARKFIQTLLECTNNPVFPWKIKVKVLKFLDTGIQDVSTRIQALSQVL